MSKEGVLFRKIAAFNEISLLVFSLVAFVFIIGETQRVSADRFTADNKNLPKVSTNPTGTQGAAYGSQNLGGKEESLTIPSKDPETPGGGLGIEGFISELFGGGIGKGWGIGNLVAGVAWGGVVAGVIQMAGGLLGATPATKLPIPHPFPIPPPNNSEINPSIPNPPEVSGSFDGIVRDSSLPPKF